jgi:hypothetical protein
MTQAQTSAYDGGQPKASDPKLSVSDLYVQAYTNMRATDEISLKLLAAIPFVSGVGISLLVRKPTEAFPAEARLLVSLFAAVVTFAIYRWECRNISNCRRYRDCAAELERPYLDELLQNGKASLQKNDVPNSGSPGYWFLSWRWVKWIQSWKWGKTAAERLLYWTVIVGWLATGIYVFSYDVGG